MQHKRVHLLCALLHAFTLFISSGLTTAVVIAQVIGEVASECAAEDKCLSPSVCDEDKFAIDTTAAGLRAGKLCLDAMSKSRVRLGDDRDVPATSGLSSFGAASAGMWKQAQDHTIACNTATKTNGNLHVPAAGVSEI